MNADDEPESEHFELDDLLWLIAEMPRAVSTAQELLADAAARDIALAPAALAALAKQAQDADLVHIWDHQGRLYLTLSPLAAGRMGVALEEDSKRFYRLADPFHVPVDVLPPSHWVETDYASYVDPAQPEPLDAMVAEESSRGELIGPDTRRLLGGQTVRVRHVLGLERAWPLVREPGADCPGCGSRRLPRAAYCAICHRAGVDVVMPPVEPELQQYARKTYRGAKLKGGVGPTPAEQARRQGVKERRQRKRQEVA